MAHNLAYVAGSSRNTQIPTDLKALQEEAKKVSRPAKKLPPPRMMLIAGGWWSVKGRIRLLVLSSGWIAGWWRRTSSSGEMNAPRRQGHGGQRGRGGRGEKEFWVNSPRPRSRNRPGITSRYQVGPASRRSIRPIPGRRDAGPTNRQVREVIPSLFLNGRQPLTIPGPGALCRHRRGTPDRENRPFGRLRDRIRARDGCGGGPDRLG